MICMRGSDSLKLFIHKCTIQKYCQVQSSSKDRGVVAKEGVSLSRLKSLKVGHMIGEERVIPGR